MPQNWEYGWTTVAFRNDDAVVAELNEWGRNGWEAVGVTETHGPVHIHGGSTTNGFWVLFKRPLQENAFGSAQ